MNNSNDQVTRGNDFGVTETPLEANDRPLAGVNAVEFTIKHGGLYIDGKHIVTDLGYDLDNDETTRELVESIAEHFAAQSQPLSDWRDIETAPKDGTRIMVWQSPWNYPSMAYYLEGWFTVGGQLKINPTHWKPLDPPPTATPTEPADPLPGIQRDDALDESARQMSRLLNAPASTEKVCEQLADFDPERVFCKCGCTASPTSGGKFLCDDELCREPAFELERPGMTSAPDCTTSTGGGDSLVTGASKAIQAEGDEGINAVDPPRSIEELDEDVETAINNCRNWIRIHADEYGVIYLSNRTGKYVAKGSTFSEALAVYLHSVHPCITEARKDQAARVTERNNPVEPIQ